MDWPDQKMLLGGGHKQRKRNPGQNSPLRSQWRGHMNEREVIGDWHSSISAIGRISHQYCENLSSLYTCSISVVNFHYRWEKKAHSLADITPVLHLSMSLQQTKC